jgi:tetratricopeptide (TPR) repeat protein
LPLQYIGKVFLPFNLSVFPQVADTTMLYGWVAISFLIFVFIIQRKQIDWKWMVFGLGWFFIFLLPSLMVPKYINSQSFEHRLYLPMLGLVWCIQPCFKGLSTKYLYALLCIYSITFVWINFNQQKFYKNELKFWKQAVLDSPSSAYAHKILSVRYYTHNKRDLSKVEAQKALAIDSTEKYANYYLGKYYYDHEQWEQAYAWMLKELNHNPQFIDAVFDLARVSYELGNKNQSIVYLEQATMIAPNLVLAKQNLLLMYMELNQREKALAKIEFWKKNNEPLPDGYAKIVGI